MIFAEACAVLVVGLHSRNTGTDQLILKVMCVCGGDPAALGTLVLALHYKTERGS